MGVKVEELPALGVVDTVHDTEEQDPGVHETDDILYPELNWTADCNTLSFLHEAAFTISFAACPKMHSVPRGLRIYPNEVVPQNLELQWW